MREDTDGDLRSMETVHTYVGYQLQKKLTKLKVNIVLTAFSLSSLSLLILVPIETIREIRVGRNTENLRNSESCFEELAEDCAFSIIWGEEYQCLDLIANTPDEANIWVTGLVALTSGNCKLNICNAVQKLSCKAIIFSVPQDVNSSQLSTSTLRDKWLEDTYDDQMKDTLADEIAICKLIQQINPKLPLAKIQQKIKVLLMCLFSFCS